ncbi:MAG: AAA family ATPase [Chitinophagales bacterium]|nr:AAA family ATPase [Chitinophagales bacterium]
MKIAVCGKGGVGKTTISGMLCRLLGRSGMPVLAIDGDPNPNLALILGIDPLAPSPPALSTDLLEVTEKEDGKRYATLGVSLQEVMDTYGLKAPDNVTLLAVGQPEHAATGCMCGLHTTVREIVHSALEESDRVTVLDLEASLEQMKRGTSKYVDILLCVVEPYYRSLEAAARFYRLGKELGIKKIVAVANKVKNAEDEKAIREFFAQIDLPVEAIIPYDEELAATDAKGISVLNNNYSSPAIVALTELANRLLLN